MKLAILSMDVEDWHHTTYLPGADTSPASSMLDGVDEFASILRDEGVTGTFFTLSCLSTDLAGTLRRLREAGHEIACHGDDHTLPYTLSDGEFARRVGDAKRRLEDVIGARVVGYRAPCFALDVGKLAALAELGFSYDASWIRFVGHPLYGSMDLAHWPELTPGVRRAPDSTFLEFEVSTKPWRRWYLPVAGGGSFRMVPWPLMNRWIASYLQTQRTYIFYIHPFECSAVARQQLPGSAGVLDRLRFNIGRSGVRSKIRMLIALLRAHGYTLTTHQQVAEMLVT